MRLLICVFCILITCNVWASDYKPMDGYSLAPLETPVFDYAEVIVDFVAFNNWLNVNYSKLDAQSMKGAREHLYYLLSSYVSELNKRDGLILPKRDDFILQTILSWGERLGVYGAHICYNKVKKTNAKAMSGFMEIPEEFSMLAVNDMYLVQSKKGNWSVRFPYYFMIGHISEFNATNGMQTQVLTVSTGAVKDNTQTGRSQSTLMLVYTPSKELKKFKNYWLTQLGIDGEKKTQNTGLNHLKSFYVYEEKSQLHKEVTLLPSKQGSYLVAYLGMDGAYQKNRPHYLDFLSQIHLEPLKTDTLFKSRDTP